MKRNPHLDILQGNAELQTQNDHKSSNGSRTTIIQKRINIIQMSKTIDVIGQQNNIFKVPKENNSHL